MNPYRFALLSNDVGSRESTLGFRSTKELDIMKSWRLHPNAG